MNNYQSSEMQLIEQRAHKVSAAASNRMFLRLMACLCFFAVYTASLYASPIDNVAANGQGAAWKCSNCRTYQWQASNNKDWAGNYKCNSCGAKK